MAQSNKPAGPCCPHCGSVRVQRLRRRFVDRYIMGILFVRPFHCVNCYRRFYSRAKSPAAPADELRAILSRAAPSTPPSQESKGQASASAAAASVAPAAAVAERRGFSRQPCEIAALAYLDIPEQTAGRISGMVTDISLTGCFLRSHELLPVGTELELSLEAREAAHSRSVVRRVTPAKGMGLEFVFTSGLNFRRLQHIAPGSVRLNPTP